MGRDPELPESVFVEILVVSTELGALDLTSWLFRQFLQDLSPLKLLVFIVHVLYVGRMVTLAPVSDLVNSVPLLQIKTLLDSTWHYSVPAASSL